MRLREEAARRVQEPLAPALQHAGRRVLRPYGGGGASASPALALRVQGAERRRHVRVEALRHAVAEAGLVAEDHLERRAAGVRERHDALGELEHVRAVRESRELAAAGPHEDGLVGGGLLIIVIIVIITIIITTTITVILVIVIITLIMIIITIMIDFIIYSRLQNSSSGSSNNTRPARGAPRARRRCPCAPASYIYIYIYIYICIYTLLS